jgi:hypothetical protein
MVLSQIRTALKHRPSRAASRHAIRSRRNGCRRCSCCPTCCRSPPRSGSGACARSDPATDRRPRCRDHPGTGRSLRDCRSRSCSCRPTRTWRSQCLARCRGSRGPRHPPATRGSRHACRRFYEVDTVTCADYSALERLGASGDVGAVRPRHGGRLRRGTGGADGKEDDAAGAHQSRIRENTWSPHPPHAQQRSPKLRPVHLQASRYRCERRVNNEALCFRPLARD